MNRPLLYGRTKVNPADAGPTLVRAHRGVLGVTLAMCLVVLTGCRPELGILETEVPSDLFPIVLQTDWFPQAEHGGFYQAAARGFYADEGLEVEILPGGPGAMIKHKITQRRAHFAMNRSDDIIVAVDGGLPLVMVFAVMQRDPQALMTHPSHAVSGFSELDGRTVIASPGLNWITFLEKQYSIQLNIQPHTYSLARFLKDETLVQQCFVTNEPYYVRQQGVEPVILMISGSGYEPYHVVFAHREFARKEPDRVRAFTRASLRGWADYLEGDPSPANQLIAAHNPKMNPDFLAYARQTMIERRLVTGDPSKGDQLGRIDTIRLEGEILRLRELAMIDQPLAPEDLLISAE